MCLKNNTNQKALCVKFCHVTLNFTLYYVYSKYAFFKTWHPKQTRISYSSSVFLGIGLSTVAEYKKKENSLSRLFDTCRKYA